MTATLTIYLTHVVWQMFKRYSKKRLRKVRSNQIIQAYEAREEWLESYEDMASRGYFVNRFASFTACPRD
ncbi:TPA: hypothetical protein EYP66_12355 [Candidatus Poribacteria bacterium]|nr:hypothetical protein [Candidatus Poribacteria bacterium]